MFPPIDAATDGECDSFFRDSRINPTERGTKNVDHREGK